MDRGASSGELGVDSGISRAEDTKLILRSEWRVNDETESGEQVVRTEACGTKGEDDSNLEFPGKLGFCGSTLCHDPLCHVIL